MFHPSSRVQPCKQQVKIQEQPSYYNQPSQIQKIKAENNPSNKIGKPDMDDLFSRQSEANWNFNHYGRDRDDQSNADSNDNRSSGSRRSKKAGPSQQDLCKAILTLRKKLPARSLQQVIIRLYQTIDQKKKSDQVSNVSKISKKHKNKKSQKDPSEDLQKLEYFDDDSKSIAAFSVNSSILNYKTKQNHLEVRKDNEFMEEQAYYKKNQESSFDNHIKNSQNYLKEKIQHQKKFTRTISADQGQESSEYSSPLQIHNKQPRYTGVSYIYRPKGQQVVAQFLQKNTRKTAFINIEEQTRYNQRRVMAKSFVGRGYGVTECRKQIQSEALNIQMHRNTYKNLSGSVIILAFRKLQSFIANQCGKSIKFLDRWQMRSICTSLLNCRTNMQPELMETLFKFIKAGYGIGDVTIGQIESVKLYIATQRFIHGKNVTMQSLERMGQIMHKKHLELTLDYLNRKKMRREQRLIKLRKIRLQVRQKRLRQREQDRVRMRNGKFQPNGPRVYGTESQVKFQGDSYPQPPKRCKYQLEPDYNSEFSVKQEQVWVQPMDIDLATFYSRKPNMLETILLMQDKYTELQNWTTDIFHRRFSKLVKRAVKKIQLQSQLSEESNFPILNKLDKDQMRNLIKMPQAQTTRCKLLAYFLLEEPNLEKLKQAVVACITFIKDSDKQGEQGCYHDHRPGQRANEKGTNQSDQYSLMSQSLNYKSAKEYYEDVKLKENQPMETCYDFDPDDFDLNTNQLKFEVDECSQFQELNSPLEFQEKQKQQIIKTSKQLNFSHFNSEKSWSHM